MISAAETIDARRLVEAEIVERERDADELGDDRQTVEQEQVDDAERAPELAEALEDEARVPDAGDGAEPQHHLLIDVENRDQQRHRPQQRRAVILAGLAVGRKCAGVVVAGHDDQPRAENGQKRRKPMLPRFARSDIAVKDGSESALDVAEVRVVEDSGHGAFDVGFGGHGSAPLPLGAGASLTAYRPLVSLRPRGGRIRIGFGFSAHRSAANSAGGPTRAVVHSRTPSAGASQGDRRGGFARGAAGCPKA